MIMINFKLFYVGFIGIAIFGILASIYSYICGSLFHVIFDMAFVIGDLVMLYFVHKQEVKQSHMVSVLSSLEEMGEYLKEQVKIMKSES
jgi:hypothetical protein